jgi:hypothetical protein
MAGGDDTAAELKKLKLFIDQFQDMVGTKEDSELLPKLYAQRANLEGKLDQGELGLLLSRVN